jgi:hypothetical protein
MVQVYTSEVARNRMFIGLCPECASSPSAHTGAGGPGGCTLTDNGVVERIAYFAEVSAQALRDTVTRSPDTS